MYFGVVATKAEVLSWFRIQEMFRFQSFHMYGIIGSAVATGLITFLLIKKFKLKSVEGEEIKIIPKEFHKSFFYGGFIFGLGWGLAGYCPGPALTSLASGNVSAVIFSAGMIAGIFAFGFRRVLSARVQRFSGEITQDM